MLNFSTILVIIHTTFCLLLAIVGLVVDPTGRIYVWIARRLWGPPLLKLAGIRLTVSGGHDVDWRKPYVVASNHASQLDIPVLFASLPMPVRFMAKKSLFYFPVFGWSLWLAHFIPVDRSGARKARESLNRAALKVRNGRSLIVFPEGTRCADGTIQPFKSGAFVLAIKAQVPVLPVAIRGSFDVFPKDTLKIRKGHIEVFIGTPIPTKTLELADKETLRAKTQQSVNHMFKTGIPG